MIGHRNARVWIIFMIGMIACLNGGVCRGASVAADSIATEYRFDARQLIVPGVAIGIGAWGAADGWMHHVDKEINRGFHFGGTALVDDAFEYLPLGADLLLGVAGVQSRYSFADRAISAATALVLVEVSVQSLKHSVRVMRPDGSDSHSFPSGHSAVSFMGAELTRIHYGGAWGWSAYGVAAATAVLRIGHQRHWLSDVVAGAGIGILSARAAMWLLPLENKLFHRRGSNRRGNCQVSRTSVIPFGYVGGGGLAIVHTF